MNVLASLLVLVAFGVAAALAIPATRRTGLGIWHPVIAWLVLDAVFFGVGSIRLAIDGRVGPALYVAGAALALGFGVAVSDRLARQRATAGSAAAPDPSPETSPEGARHLGSWRPAVAIGLAALGMALVLPTLLRVGLPALADDITGARSELTGLTVQELRVAFPALALGLLLTAAGRPRAWQAASYAAIVGLLVFDLALASRYLGAELVAVLLVGVGLAGWRLPWRWLATVAVIGIVAFGGIQVLRAYDQAAGRELAFAVERTVNRVILIQPRTLEALQDVIPDEQPYFGGLTWARRLGPVLGRPDIPNLGYWIYPRVFPDQDPPGYLAPGIVGEAWANFGPAGLGLFVLLGILVERLGAVLAWRRRGTGDVIAGAIAVVFVARTHALGVNGLAILVALVVGVATPGGRRHSRALARYPDGDHVANLTGLRRRVRADWPVALGLGAGIVAVVVVRTALFGWSPAAPDDARYLFVGLSMLRRRWAGHTVRRGLPTAIAALRGGARGREHGPRRRSLTGAEVIALGLAILCLLGAIRLGWLLAGPGGAVGTTLVTRWRRPSCGGWSRRCGSTCHRRPG